MRIAIIAPPWLPVPPPAYGGTEAVLDGLARGLSAAGHQVMLFTTGDSTCRVAKRWVFAEAVGVGATGKAGARATAVELRHIVHAYDAVQSWNPDVIHDHTLIGPLYAGHLPAAPVVTTNHAPFDGDTADFYRALSRRVPIIAISHHQASTAIDTTIAAVIHHGIDVDTYDVGRGAGGYALFLGRMCAEKGVRAAIEAARGAGMPLKIAAKVREPAEQEYFEAHVKPLLGRDVEFLGEVGGADKVQLVGAATCLLNPIAWPEPFGMVMIEALASGTPVVATPCGAVPEIVTDGVTGFIRATHAGLVRAVSEAPNLSRAACRAAAVARFSIERMVADHVALYERVAQRDKGLVTRR